MGLITAGSVHGLPPPTEPGPDDVPGLVACLADPARWCETGRLPHEAYAMAVDGSHVALLEGGKVHIYNHTWVVNATADAVSVRGWKHVVSMVPTGGPNTGYTFGTLNAIAMEGHTVVVGAYQEESTAFWAGAAYVFAWHEDGTWTQQARLLASDSGPGHLFGAAVDVDGDRLVVGAYRNGAQSHHGGAVYVFERDSAGTWTEKERLHPSDHRSRVLFGRSVAVHGDQVVVGAEGSHQLYTFERDGAGAWVETARWSVGTGTHDIAFDGDTLATGGLNLALDWVVVLHERDEDGVWQRLPLELSAGGTVHVKVYLSLDAGRLIVTGVPDNVHIVDRQPLGDWAEAATLARTGVGVVTGDTIVVANGTVYECGLPGATEPVAVCGLDLGV